MKALGVESESFGNLLVPVLTEKIPSELRLIISRKFGSKETWDLDVLLNALKSELDSRERCNAVKTSSPINSNPRFDQQRGRFKQPLSSSALYARSEECTLQCVFCKKNHKSITCSTITELKARRTILRRSGRCFVCLKEGHITPICQSKARCFNCGASADSPSLCYLDQIIRKLECILKSFFTLVARDLTQPARHVRS